MTAPKAATRRRRTSGSSIPRTVVDWLQGLVPKTPWGVRAFPGYVLLVSDWWPTWTAEHPNAVPPAGYEWLTDASDARHRIRPLVLVNARNCAGRFLASLTTAAATSPPPAR